VTVPELTGGVFLVGGGWRWGDLVVARFAADRVAELLDALTQGAAGVRESLRPEKQKRDDQEYEQVSGLQDAGEQGCLL
jgi:hypothetical protein